MPSAATPQGSRTARWHVGSLAPAEPAGDEAHGDRSHGDSALFSSPLRGCLGKAVGGANESAHHDVWQGCHAGTDQAICLKQLLPNKNTSKCLIICLKQETCTHWRGLQPCLLRLQLRLLLLQEEALGWGQGGGHGSTEHVGQVPAVNAQLFASPQVWVSMRSN